MVVLKYHSPLGNPGFFRYIYNTIKTKGYLNNRIRLSIKALSSPPFKINHFLTNNPYSLMYPNARFIIKPNFKNLSESELKYTDILTYITIRSFYNSKDKYCYPSYNTIASLAKLSKKFVGDSIKRLDGAGFLDVWKIGTVRVRHSYMFSDVVAYQKVPYQIFQANDLTANEKSMLLLLREHCDQNLAFHQSISEIASASGLSYRTIHKQFSSLVLKGYISDQILEDASSKSLCRVFKLTDKVEWRFTMTSSSYLIKAKASETQSKSLAIVSMATQIFRKMNCSSRE